jgi:hypothetical protein
MARTYTRPTLPAPTEALLTFDDEVTFFSVHEDVEKRFPVVREGHVKVARDNTVTIYEKYAKPKRKDAKNRYGHHWLLRFVRLRTIVRDGAVIAALPHLPEAYAPVPAPEPTARPRRTLPAGTIKV